VLLHIQRDLHRRLLPHILLVKLALAEECYPRIRYSYLLVLFDVLWRVNDISLSTTRIMAQITFGVNMIGKNVYMIG